jgi:hypothetical protein
MRCYIKDYYGKDLDNIICIIGDSAPTNGLMAKIMDKPLIRCKAHLLNLYVDNEYLLPYQATIAKIHNLLVQCRRKNNINIISNAAGLKPLLNNDTRWTSTYLMVKRFYNKYYIILY